MALFVPNEYANLVNALTGFDDDWDFARPSQFLASRYPVRNQQVRPYRTLQSYLQHFDNTVSGLVNDKDNFKVNLDVQQYKPEDITVKVMDKFVVIEGKHEERADEHGFISRQFQRRYRLPNDVDPNTIASQLSSDGVLTIAAPKKATQIEHQRNVPITMTNQPAVKQAEAKADQAPEKMQQ